MSKPKLILIGGGGHCKSCIDVIEQEDKFEIAGILDVPEKKGERILNYEILSKSLVRLKLVFGINYCF